MSGERTLLLLRHAKSSWDGDAFDHERPLNGRGLRDAPRIGRLLRELGVPELIVGSSARRVRQTIDGVLSEAGYEGEVLLTPRLYLTDAASYLSELARASSGYAAHRGGAPARVLLVGHNPTLEELLMQLTGSIEELPTGALVVLTSSALSWDELAQAGATRVAVHRPRELPDDD